MGKSTAIILAAGRGKRMGTDVPKQFLEVNGHPIVYYTIKAFEVSNVDSVIIVTGATMIEYFKENIIDCGAFKKIKAVVAGGSERYLSVANGIKAVSDDCQKVLIHDGARPMVSIGLINRILDELDKYPAVIPGIAVKDTIKQIDSEGFVCETPLRSALRAVQTPQGFDFKKLRQAYGRIPVGETDPSITDDACVFERFADTKEKVYITEGEENNIKITTPEDLLLMESIIGAGEK